MGRIVLIYRKTKIHFRKKRRKRAPTYVIPARCAPDRSRSRLSTQETVGALESGVTTAIGERVNPEVFFGADTSNSTTVGEVLSCSATAVSVCTIGRDFWENSASLRDYAAD